MALNIARLRVLLKATGEMRLHPQQAGEVYALVARAWGEGRAGEPALPDGMMIDVPEQCRVRVVAGEHYAFGMTWLQAEGEPLGPAVAALRRGLEIVGRTEDRRRPVFGGNFDVEEIRDLVSGVPWNGSHEPARIPEAHLVSEVTRLRDHETLRIDFLSPVRIQRAAAERLPGHKHLDDRDFQLRGFVDALKRRLEALGFEAIAAGLGWDPPPLERTAQAMAWLDLAWGPVNRRKRLGGALGQIAVKVHDPRVLTALVLGQYLQVGSNTRFGFGRYRIRELGPDPYPCPRATGLMALAFVEGGLDRVAAEFDIESGGLQRAAAAVAVGTYVPDPPTRSLRRIGAKTRELAVPSRQDRALQTAVVRQLAPALDLLFERSSFAYRSGLGTHSAARRIRTAFRSGFVHALKADFRQFFDTVDHRLLETRLRAYLRDDTAADVILGWVWTASPEKGRGLPTGAPISPLLANLFLDTFDEEIARRGCRLVRYADDFLILFRDPDHASEVLAIAKDAASALLLELNNEKTKWFDLREPFEFLGIRFERSGVWAAEAPAGPTHLQDLGWHAARPQPRSGLFRLPGEVEAAVGAATESTTVVIGPRPGTLDLAEGHLVFRGQVEGDVASVPITRVQEVVSLGTPALTASAVRGLVGRELPLWILGRGGGAKGVLRGAEESVTAEVLAAQVRIHGDEAASLKLARPLIAAKLRNYAALAEVTAGDASSRSLPADLRRLAKRAEVAPSQAVLLGIEGSGAALWYGDFRSRLTEAFTWSRRVAPAASDPVNALLNFAHTLLHKEALSAVLRAGLAPTLGVFHRPRAGHASLASDLQEPFRHLMDRVVLVAVREFRGDDFEYGDGDPPIVHLRPPVLRRFAALIHESFATPVRLPERTEAITYRQHFGILARDLKRCLLGGTDLQVFASPRPDAPPPRSEDGRAAGSSPKTRSPAKPPRTPKRPAGPPSPERRAPDPPGAAAPSRRAGPRLRSDQPGRGDPPEADRNPRRVQDPTGAHSSDASDGAQRRAGPPSAPEVERSGGAPRPAGAPSSSTRPKDRGKKSGSSDAGRRPGADPRSRDGDPAGDSTNPGCPTTSPSGNADDPQRRHPDSRSKVPGPGGRRRARAVEDQESGPRSPEASRRDVDWAIPERAPAQPDPASVAPSPGPGGDDADLETTKVGPTATTLGPLLRDPETRAQDPAPKATDLAPKATDLDAQAPHGIPCPPNPDAPPGTPTADSSAMNLPTASSRDASPGDPTWDTNAPRRAPTTGVDARLGHPSDTLHLASCSAEPVPETSPAAPPSASFLPSGPTARLVPSIDPPSSVPGSRVDAPDPPPDAPPREDSSR